MICRKKQEAFFLFTFVRNIVIVTTIFAVNSICAILISIHGVLFALIISLLLMRKYLNFKERKKKKWQHSSHKSKQIDYDCSYSTSFSKEEVETEISREQRAF